MATVRTNPLRTQTFQSIPLGINQSVPPHMIPDTQARWVQDLLLDKVGEARQRGPVKATSNITATNAGRPQGFMSVIAPDGTLRLGVLSGTGTPALKMLNAGFSSILSTDWGSSSWASAPPIYQANPALKGG